MQISCHYHRTLRRSYVSKIRTKRHTWLEIPSAPAMHGRQLKLQGLLLRCDLHQVFFTTYAVPGEKPGRSQRKKTAAVLSRSSKIIHVMMNPKHLPPQATSHAEHILTPFKIHEEGASRDSREGQKVQFTLLSRVFITISLPWPVPKQLVDPRKCNTSQADIVWPIWTEAFQR